MMVHNKLNNMNEQVMVKTFSGSVIRSECLVGLDPEVVCDVRLKSRIAVLVPVGQV